MKTLDEKLIVYDSNCAVCSSMRKVVLMLTPIQKNRIIAFKDLTPGLDARVDPARFKNGMALIDLAGRETLYGADGVAYIFSSQYRIIGSLLRINAVFRLFSFLYKTLAYNRYTIATPKSSFECDCIPDRIVAYRWNFVVMAFALAILLTALFGMTLTNFVHGLSPWRAAVEIILIAGTGWSMQLILAIIAMKEKALDYAGHVGSIMVAGLIILVPWMVFHVITGTSLVIIPVGSAVLSSGVMTYLHVHRVRYLGLSQGWTVSWFVLLESTALCWIYFFHGLYLPHLFS